MKFTLHLFLLLIFLSAGFQAWPQAEKRDSLKVIPLFYGFYGYQWPGADMAKRFGTNSEIGGGFQVKTRDNWIAGLEYTYLFGNDVKNSNDLFRHLMTHDHIIINGDGVPAEVGTFERGSLITARFGKLIPLSKINRNSGILLMASVGYMLHKIRIEVVNESVPQLKGDYKRGYDRLTAGFTVGESVGYMYIGKHRLINFYAGVECYQGWTRNLRDYYFDEMAYAHERRFEILVGPKVAWIIPLNKRVSEGYYYY
jgi:hypothetical protein